MNRGYLLIALSTIPLLIGIYAGTYISEYRHTSPSNPAIMAIYPYQWLVLPLVTLALAMFVLGGFMAARNLRPT